MQTIVHVSLAQALSKGPPPAGNLAVPVFSHGLLVVELYTPIGHDPQKPHSRDEIYIAPFAPPPVQSAGVGEILQPLLDCLRYGDRKACVTLRDYLVCNWWHPLRPEESRRVGKRRDVWTGGTHYVGERAVDGGCALQLGDPPG
jgi:hypothetical protein